MRITKLCYLPLFIILFAACKPEYKKCSFKTDDVHLQAYNDVLNEIIIHGTYDRYLGKYEDTVFKMYADSYDDSDKIKQVDEDVITAKFPLAEMLFASKSRTEPECERTDERYAYHHQDGEAVGAQKFTRSESRRFHAGDCARRKYQRRDEWP